MEIGLVHIEVMPTRPPGVTRASCTLIASIESLADESTKPPESGEPRGTRLSPTEMGPGEQAARQTGAPKINAQFAERERTEPMTRKVPRSTRVVKPPEGELPESGFS